MKGPRPDQITRKADGKCVHCGEGLGSHKKDCPVESPPAKYCDAGECDELANARSGYEFCDAHETPHSKIPNGICVHDGCSKPHGRTQEVGLCEEHTPPGSFEFVNEEPEPPAIKIIHYDPVNHPSHYTSSPAECSRCGCAIECIDVTRHMNFNTGNAVKYMWRCGMKGDAVEDLKKALFYLRDEIRRRGGDPDEVK